MMMTWYDFFCSRICFFFCHQFFKNSISIGFGQFFSAATAAANKFYIIRIFLLFLERFFQFFSFSFGDGVDCRQICKFVFFDFSKKTNWRISFISGFMMINGSRRHHDDIVINICIMMAIFFLLSSFSFAGGPL